MTTWDITFSYVDDETDAPHSRRVDFDDSPPGLTPNLAEIELALFGVLRAEQDWMVWPDEFVIRDVRRVN